MTLDASAGATPVVPGATPGQTPATPAASAPTPGTASATDGYPDGLGDAGKRALDVMKAERDAAVKAQKAAERRATELETATATDAEKALAKARQEGGAEVLAKAQDQVRRSEVKAALAGAGLPASLIAYVARGDEFASLTVNDEGEVEGLQAAVESFKKGQPELFKATPRAPGDAGLGPRGTAPGSGTDLNSWIRREAGRI